jgi:hypothetical protein
MITSNSNMKMKMTNDEDILVDLGMADVELVPVCLDDSCDPARPYGQISFSTVVLAHSEAYCVIMKAEKDALARRFEAAIVGDSIVKLGGYVTAVRIDDIANTDHLAINVNVQLTTGPSHQFTCN